MHNKVRKVRCPKCWRVLPEPPEVPVYECGNCGTKLQAKRRNNTTIDTTTQRLDEDSSGKRKVERVLVDEEAGSSSNKPCLFNSTHESDETNETSDGYDIYSANKDQDAGNKRAENGAVDASESVVEEGSSEKLKIKQLSDNQEPCCSSNPQSLVNSSDEPDEKIHNDLSSSTEFSGHENPESSPEDTAHNIIDQEQNQNQNQENDTVVKLEHSSKQKIEQLFDDNAASSMDELDRKNDHNEHRSSSELSNHDNPKLSPEATVHNKVNRADTQFVSGKNETKIEDSISEFEEAVANTTIFSDSDVGSKSRFKSNMTAERLLDTRQKRAVYLDEDDLLSEDGSANLHHRRRFNRVSSVETLETTRYGYEGSVSSYDGNDNETPRKNLTNSGNRFRFNRRNEFHSLNSRLFKDEHRVTDVRSFYRSNEFHEKHSHRPPVIPENSRLERIELLKLVQELQDQLERANISNPQQVPSYYNHSFNNQGRHSQRMAFSGDPTAVNRRRDDSFCHHCYPQHRHFSAQLPGHHHICSNRPNYRLNSYHIPQFSGSSSSMHKSSESNFSTSDNQRKPCRSAKKRYVRPVARGSPWIACYRCSKLLELPQSFLVFNKQSHSLRCGSCLKMLNFTLSNGTRVSRYYPEQTHAAPPSSEVEDFDKLTGSWAGPVSCSDRSFEKDYSTETDRNGSREFSVEGRKATMSRNPTRTPPCRKTTSEIETVEPKRKGSALHRLMGYDSPSKVIRD